MTNTDFSDHVKDAPRTWSPYQTAVFDFLSVNEADRTKPRRSLIVRAVAGSGKTTLCIEAIRQLEQRSLSILYAAFNTSVRAEMEQRAITSGLRCTISTAHSLGLSALRRSLPSAKLNKNKLYDLAQSCSPPKLYKLIPDLCKLVTFAKDRGLGLPSFPAIESLKSWQDIIDHHDLEFEFPVEKVIAAATALLMTSNDDLTSFDFSDMIYLALLKECQFQKYDYVFVDEAQDTNATKRLLYSYSKKPWGAFVVVGDEWQAIYGFTGADNDSMKVFKEEMQCEELPLSICYRCSTAVIKHAQRWMKDIQASDSAACGSVRQITYDHFLMGASGFGAIKEDSLSPNDVILCRFNAPNARLALQLIRKGIPCRIEGRDIGVGLIKRVEKFNQSNIASLKVALREWYSGECAKEKLKQSTTDIYETLLALIQRADDLRITSVDALVSDVIRPMFSDEKDVKRPVLTLSSIHKAKGKEWDRVFLLGRDSLMPSPLASSSWEREQELHLIYVAITRAKHTLVEITNIPEK